MKKYERRQFGRRRTAIHAIIKAAGRPPEPCIVRNISANGALVEFGKKTWLPYTFELVIDGDQFKADCEWKHSSGNAVGLVFLSRQREALAKYG